MNTSTNWTFWLLILLGNGIIMTAVTMFQQYLFHKQNLKLEKEKHRQNLELEEKKRTDYLVCCNYDELFEVSRILYQILLTWFQVTLRAEEQKKKVEIKIGDKIETAMNLWDYACPIHEKFKTEQTTFARFIKQYDYLIPDEVCNKISEANDEYKKDNFNKAQELIIDAEISLSNILGIKKSQRGIKKRLELLSK